MRILPTVIVSLMLLLLSWQPALASGGEKPRAVTYQLTPPAPRTQLPDQAMQKSAGCISCHTKVDSLSMHASPGIILGCTDCHGGNAAIYKKDFATEAAAKLDAHVQPTLPHTWGYPSAANPKHSYTLLNREAAEYIRFVNPGDLRVAREACGNCHLSIIQASERSLMSTSAMLWGGAAYNNNILPFKRYILGEAYTREGAAATLINPVKPDAKLTARGVLPQLLPLPAWETVPPSDVFRVFEDGGRNILNLFPEIGLPNSLGQL
nr:hypothetical protein [Alphaproteobacteria bacterium]